jgi:hypothetical protein
MTTLVGLKMTEEEIEALDALTVQCDGKSRSDTIRLALKSFNVPGFVNPFRTPFVNCSRKEHPARRRRKPSAQK